MKIDRNLNLVFPVESEKGPLYVHSAPISREVFETYALVIGAAFEDMHRRGLNAISGPRVAMQLLKNAAMASGEWNDPNDAGRNAALVENGLMNEIRRLSNVVMPGERGWVTMPYHDALAKKVIGADDAAEVENAIVFFTLTFWMHRPAQRRIMMAGMESLWGAQIVSSSCTEYAASLPTSTPDASSGAAAAASSVPS